jgi:hypothetical protein
MESPAPTAATLHDLFFHVRVIVGIVVGLSMARLLTGLARFVQHPGRDRIYPVHLAWAGFLILAVVHFWWFQFGLSRIERWTFEVYIFVICYAALYFFICTLLFPDSLADYDGFADYFHSRQKWFYGLLAALFLVDLADTALKGAAHFRSYGISYPIQQSMLAALAVAAMFVKPRWVHGSFAALAILIEVAWILRQFEVLE